MNGTLNSDMIGDRNAALLLFLIGLASLTQINIGGKLGISEFVMVVCAPFVFLKNYKKFQMDGTLYYFVLLFLWLMGAIVVDVYTGNALPLAMRGIAVPVTVFANSVCIYVLLRRNYDNLKWLLLGVAISGVVSIFIFQRGIAGDLAAEQGMDAGIETVVGYKLFWVDQFRTWFTLPISGWYQSVPKLYSILALLFLAIYNLTSGGRSAFLIVSLSLLFVAFAGKTRSSMAFLRKHATLIVLLLCMLGVGTKVAYKYAATHGYMGDAEFAKYEKSTEHGSGALDLLLEGRSEFFIGLMAALDKPFLGHGSVAIDDHGYVLDFVKAHGDIAAYERIIRARSVFGVRVIPAHSQIVMFWMWHGIFALGFWLCVMVLAGKTLLFRMHVYPPWFGYFAVTIPAFFWDVLFSPFGGRVTESILFVALLLVSALARKERVC